MKAIYLLLVYSFVSLNFFQSKEKEVQLEFCGDYGFGGQHLSLYQDHSFKYSYYGCSESNGSLEGNWRFEGDSLKLTSTVKNSPLNDSYLKTDKGLEAYGRLELGQCL